MQEDGGGAATPIEGTATVGTQGTFGAAISGPILNIWITSAQGTLLSAVIDTSTYNLPGSATMGAPTVDDSFVTVIDAMAGTNRTSTGGAIVVDQCPKTVGEAFTGKFNNVAMVDEISGATSTLTGTFNLKIIAKSGDLVCKVTPTPGPDAGPTDDAGPTVDIGGGGTYPGAGQASCSNPTCDGPCCPYLPCLATCTFACETGTCVQNPMDFMACATCLNDCVTSCNVSQPCITAAQAVNECESTNACNEAATDEAADACLAANCCSQLQAAY
jgi:hypothetical protein